MLAKLFIDTSLELKKGKLLHADRREFCPHSNSLQPAYL